MNAKMLKLLQKPMKYLT